MRLSNESTLLTGTLRGLTALWFRLSEACGRLGPIRVGPTRKMADPWQECMDYAVALARQAGEVRAGTSGPRRGGRGRPARSNACAAASVSLDT